MLNFTNAPPLPGRGQSMPLLRTPADRVLDGIVLSNDLLGCNTHFWGGRTYPCLGDGCPACLQASPWRWHGYMACKAVHSSFLFLFEITAAGAEAFVSYRHDHGTLRGCHWRAKRFRSSPNGQVMVTTEPWAGEYRHLPPEPNLSQLLHRLWNLPYEHAQRIDPPRHQDDAETIDQILPSI